MSAVYDKELYKIRLEKLLYKFEEYDDQQYTYNEWLNYDREEDNFWFNTDVKNLCIQNLSIKTVETIINDLEETKEE